jgi:hypothetical protein
MTASKQPPAAVAAGRTPQGLGAQGPGNAHGVPPDHEDTEGKPFDPRGGQPAADPEEAARKLLERHNTGPQDADAGPEAAGTGRPGSR